MSRPLEITIPHRLTRQQAKDRLQSGMGQIHAQLAPYTNSVESHWTEDRMDFRMAALGQAVTGRIDVLDDSVRIEVHLPWALSLLGTRIGDRIRKQGTRMLTKA